MPKVRDSLLALFGRKIRQLRKKLKLSQEDLALAAGIDTSYLGMVERGEKAATLKTISKLAKALKITYVELFDFSNIREEEYGSLQEKFYTVIRDSDTRDMAQVALDNIIAYKQKKTASKSN